MITLLFDIDGVLVEQVGKDCGNAYEKFNASLEFVPKSWQTYHETHTITLNYKEEEDSIYLLLPGVLEMLEFFSIHLQEKVHIAFFSAGSKERNEPFCNALMKMVAKKAKVNFKSLVYIVYSRDDCDILAVENELQPRSNNNPHVPENSTLWSWTHKKVLSKFFQDISNVVLIDDQYFSMINTETANHLKALTCRGFTGLNLQNFRENGLSIEQQLIKNQEFFRKRTFFEANQAYYITGLILTMIERSEQLNITASAALEALQLCPQTNKYKQALSNRPLVERYEPQYFEKGFLVLQKINPLVEFFAPYPALVLKTLREMHTKKIDKYLRAVTNNSYPDGVYRIIHEYYDTPNYESSLLQAGFFAKNKALEQSKECQCNVLCCTIL